MGCRLLVCGFLVTVMMSCAGKGQVVVVDIVAKEPAVMATRPISDGLRMAVDPLEDSRLQKSKLGVRSHRWDCAYSFDVLGGSSSEAATGALTQFLNSKGWNAHIVRAALSSQAADLTISGHGLACSVDAKNRVGSTKLMTGSKRVVRVLNHADGSVVRMTLHGSRSDSVWWFEPRRMRSNWSTTCRTTVLPSGCTVPEWRVRQSDSASRRGDHHQHHTGGTHGSQT
jgi:hypothetical protein